MRVGKIAHASTVITAGDVCCFMDPVLESPYENGANAFDPAIELDIETLTGNCNLLVLTHEHMDHFSPRSLDRFDRETPVIYPTGAKSIELALDRLGFSDRTAAAFGDEIDLGDVKLTPTPSRASFPEVGMLFRTATHSFWNIVDSEVDEAVVTVVRKLCGRPDLIFAAYQPLIELPLIENSLGSDFPFERYGTLLTRVWATRARHCGTIACGFRYGRDPWLNDRAFPITERQFAVDVQRGDPEMRVVHVAHGAAVDVSRECAPDPEGVPGVTRRGPVYSQYAWQPYRGVPPLVDHDPFHRGDSLRGEIDRFLAELPGRLNTQSRGWLDRLARLDVMWRLEVVFPSGPPVVRLIDFTQSPPHLGADDADVFVKLHTSVTASGIAGLLHGDHNTYSFFFNEIRVMHRLYEVYRNGVVQNGKGTDEPLMRVLFEGADARHVAAELDRIDAAKARR